MGRNTGQENKIIYPDTIKTVSQFEEHTKLLNDLLSPTLSEMIPTRMDVIEVSYGFLSDILPDCSYIGYESDPAKVMMARLLNKDHEYVNAYIPRYSINKHHDTVIIMEPWRVCQPYAQLDTLLNLSNAWHAKRYIFNYHLSVPNRYGLTKLFNVVKTYNYSFLGNDFVLSEVAI
jgi:hypothetical protein